jgi:hypothetical protein
LASGLQPPCDAGQVEDRAARAAAAPVWALRLEKLRVKELPLLPVSISDDAARASANNAESSWCSQLSPVMPGAQKHLPK